MTFLGKELEGRIAQLSTSIVASNDELATLWGYEAAMGQLERLEATVIRRIGPSPAMDRIVAVLANQRASLRQRQIAGELPVAL